VVLFSAWLATGTLAVLWWVLLRTTGLLDAIMIDRDLAAGWRGAGFLAGGGLVLGRAAAGDWVSAGQAVTDLCRHGWPALALLGAAIWLQRGFRPNLERPLPSVVRHGVLPGVAYCALAAGAVACLGRW
jgi:hypothetical protein